MGDTFQIRFGTTEDLPTLMRVINAAYEVERWFKNADRVDEAELLGLMERGRFLLLESAGALAGCVFVQMEGEGPERRGYLGLLSVDPARQGAGLSRRLIYAAEEYAREQGATRMKLTVVNVREELPPFYAKFGYRPSGTEPWPEEKEGHVLMPVHFVQMTKELV